MSPWEWWIEFDTHLAMNRRITGKLGVTGGFSEAEWADARRRHKAKMNG